MEFSPTKSWGSGDLTGHLEFSEHVVVTVGGTPAQVSPGALIVDGELLPAIAQVAIHGQQRGPWSLDGIARQGLRN